MRVLLVEDEDLLADAIAEGLRRESLAVDVVDDGEAALERLGVNDYDVLVLDGAAGACSRTRCGTTSPTGGCVSPPARMVARSG